MTKNPLTIMVPGVLSLGLLLHGVTLGQGTSNEELLETIKKLEARVAELEAQAGKKSDVSTTSPANSSESAPPSAASTANGNGNGAVERPELGSNGRRVLRL